MWSKQLKWVRRAVAAGEREMRLDRWLRHQFPALPQALVQAQLRRRRIRLEAAPGSASVAAKAKASSLLPAGAVVAIDARWFERSLRPMMARAPSAAEEDKALSEEQREALTDLERRVLFQDENFVVLDKPHGLAVQDGSALRDSLARHLPALARRVGSGDGDRDAEPLLLVHRLDRQTSGVLVLARSRIAAARFSALLTQGRVCKTYVALVRPLDTNEPLDASVFDPLPRQITLPADDRHACTIVERVLGTSKDPRGIWLELKPVTGRKHQLRVHCATALRAPIVGDNKYGGARARRLFLHAARIQFEDPFAHGRTIDVSSTLDWE